MTRITAHITIEAPAETVWAVLAHQFDRIGAWATAIPSSSPLPRASPVEGAPVAGRVCHTGMRLVTEVTERIVTYDEQRRTLTYQVENPPRFLKAARNRWQVEALSDQRTRVTMEATVEPRGVTGWLLYLALRVQLARAVPQFVEDLKHHLEQGRPSPRKQRQLDAAKRRSGRQR
jgi:hypothetical protein